MLSAGGQVPTHTEAPASASALAMANPNPASSATPATSARFPVRSMASMRGYYRNLRSIGLASLHGTQSQRLGRRAHDGRGRAGRARGSDGAGVGHPLPVRLDALRPRG